MCNIATDTTSMARERAREIIVSSYEFKLILYRVLLTTMTNKFVSHWFGL